MLSTPVFNGIHDGYGYDIGYKILDRFENLECKMKKENYLSVIIILISLQRSNLFLYTLN